MSETREQGLAALMADVLAADRPDPELLVRYVQDSRSLSPTERDEVEHHLAHTPGYSAQLSILRRMLEAKPAPQHALTRVAPRRRWRSTGSLVAMAGIAAAAALAIGVGLSSRQPSGETGSPQIARNAEPVPSLAPPAPGPDGPGTSVAPGPSTREPEPTPSPQVPEERIQLASLSLPAYARPSGAGDRPRLGSATRGSGQAISVEALVPDHVGRTLSPAPDLAYFISKIPGAGNELQFTLALEQSNQPITMAKLRLPVRAGVQRISLSALGAELAPGKRYRWSVLLRGPAAGETGFASAQGFIERAEPEAGFQARLDGTPEADRAAFYAGEGLWYDALGAVLERREQAPEDASASRALGALLDAAGLGRLKARRD